MLRFFLLPALLGAGLLVSSCTDDTDPNLPVSGIDVEELVDEYNDNLEGENEEEHAAFASLGTIVDADILTNTDGENQLTFTFVDQQAHRKFNFYLEDEVAFPEEIDRAKVVFLGHQMIVADLNGDFFVHLMAPDAGEGEDLLPELPPVEGYGLAMEADRGEPSNTFNR